MKGIARPLHLNDIRLVLNTELNNLLLSAPNLTPAGLFNQAIDELVVITSSDYKVGSGGKSSKIFRLASERLGKIRQLAADNGISENDVAIAAIRQFARNHPTYP